jgi:Holliday junction resolvasome RuvABC endonuclease subunit
MTAVLALDLSLAATGVARPDGTLSTLKPTSKGDTRLHEIPSRIAGIVSEDMSIDLVVIEDLPIGLRNAAAGSLGMLHGAVRSWLIAYELPYLTVPPATLKTYATGRGNAPKPDMRMALYKRTGTDIPDDNQVDAAWLRLLALDLAGQPELELPQTHRRALTKLTLPATAAA